MDSVIILAGSLEFCFLIEIFLKKQMLSLQVSLLMNLFWMFDRSRRLPTSRQWILPKDYRIMVQDYQLFKNSAFPLKLIVY